MRVRVVASGILAFAIVDLLVLAVAPLLGWLPPPGEATTATVVALAAAFLLALLAVIGALSVLATDFDQADLFVWTPGCGECGRPPARPVGFCDHCGAA